MAELPGLSRFQALCQKILCFLKTIPTLSIQQQKFAFQFHSGEGWMLPKAAEGVCYLKFTIFWEGKLQHLSTNNSHLALTKLSLTGLIIRAGCIILLLQ